MLDITTFTNEYISALARTFGDRVWFVGLQGSYARGEASETSDIDLVAILDELTLQDISAYNAMLDTLPYRNLICGFLSGKNEILNWEDSDLFQFYYDTKPIKGNLNVLLPKLNEGTVDKAIKSGVCNIYHGCIHNMLFDKSDEILKSLYKSASFVIQAIYFKESGKYVAHQRELLRVVSPAEKAIINTFLNLKRGKPCDFEEMSELLFIWSKERISDTKERP